MFCPRCGRPVSPAANFCGGCGMPRAEIERMIQPQAPVIEPKVETPVINLTDINNTIDQLEGDLTGINLVEDYTTDTDINTNNNTETEEIELVIEPEFEEKDITVERTDIYSAQSQYSRQAPKAPLYTEPFSEYSAQPNQTVNTEFHKPVDEKLTTVDFVWMLLISGIPVVGLIYLLYQAFMQENTIKQAWAKATLIVMAFGVLLGAIFTIGVMVPYMLYW